MNEEHLAACSSAEWAETVRRWIIPWVLDGVDLGCDVLEIGPGPGLTTDVLRTLVPRLTAVEVDPVLAEALRTRYPDGDVTVVCADAARTPLEADRFTGAVCLSMLHHVPGAEHQDALFAETLRVLRPGGVFAGEDSLDSPELRALHRGDTYVPVAPEGLAARLEAVGFTGVEVDTNEYSVRFRATRPADPGAASGFRAR